MQHASAAEHFTNRYAPQVAAFLIRKGYNTCEDYMRDNGYGFDPNYVYGPAWYDEADGSTVLVSNVLDEAVFG